MKKPLSIKGLYAIVSDAPLAREALKGRATVIQLREKEGTTRAILKKAWEIRQLTKEFGVPFIVNDRLDIALACKADGVHLGPHDLPPEEARRISPPEFIIGVSVDTVDEAKQAEGGGADYLGAGPLFPTKSKDDAGPIISLEKLRLIIKATRLPVIAIGGIHYEVLRDVIKTGVAGVAVITALQTAENPRVTAEQFSTHFRL